MSTFHVFQHPLITHKLTIMRRRETGSKDFRQLLNEITMLMGYEITRDLPLENVTIQTPVSEMIAKNSRSFQSFVPDSAWSTVCFLSFQSPRSVI